MTIMAFEPSVQRKHKFAVALYTDDKRFAILKTYETKEQLIAGYTVWRDFANKLGVSKPTPLELTEQTDDGFRCRVLDDICATSA